MPPAGPFTMKYIKIACEVECLTSSKKFRVLASVLSLISGLWDPKLESEVVMLEAFIQKYFWSPTMYETLH